MVKHAGPVGNSDVVAKSVSQYINDRLKTALGEDIAPFAAGSVGGAAVAPSPMPAVPAEEVLAEVEID